jgi:hypothetical protein
MRTTGTDVCRHGADCNHGVCVMPADRPLLAVEF